MNYKLILGNVAIGILGILLIIAGVFLVDGKWNLVPVALFNNHPEAWLINHPQYSSVDLTRVDWAVGFLILGSIFLIPVILAFSWLLIVGILAISIFRNELKKEKENANE